MISQMPANELNIKAIPIGIPINTKNSMPPKAIKPNSARVNGKPVNKKNKITTKASKPIIRILSLISPKPSWKIV